MPLSVQNSSRLGLKRLCCAIRFALALLLSLSAPIWVFNSIFDHLLVLLNCYILLFRILLSFLSLKFFHSRIVRPRTFISTNFWGISTCFSGRFPFSFQLFFAFGSHLFLRVVITESLLKHLLTDMRLLYIPCQMIFLLIHDIFSVKSICLFRHFLYLHRRDIHLRCRIN